MKLIIGLPCALLLATLSTTHLHAADPVQPGTDVWIICAGIADGAAALQSKLDLFSESIDLESPDQHISSLY